MEASDEGKARRRKADERSNEWLSQKVQRGDQATEASSESACGSREPMVMPLLDKRVLEDHSPTRDDTAADKKRGVESFEEMSAAIDNCTEELNLVEVISSIRSHWGPEEYLYDPFEWEVSTFEDMCEKELYGNIDYDQVYYDENTWEQLDLSLLRRLRRKR